MNRQTLNNHIDDLTSGRLPTLAKVTGDYPVHHDHCFKRIAFDYACGEQWDEAVEPPFYQNASEEKLYRAVLALRQMARKPEIASQLNEESLEFRNQNN